MILQVPAQQFQSVLIHSTFQCLAIPRFGLLPLSLLEGTVAPFFEGPGGRHVRKIPQHRDGFRRCEGPPAQGRRRQIVAPNEERKTRLIIGSLGYLTWIVGVQMWHLFVTAKGPRLFLVRSSSHKKSHFSPVLTPYNGRRSDRLPMTQLKESSSRPWASRLKTKPCWFLRGQGLRESDWTNGLRDLPQTLKWWMQWIPTSTPTFQPWPTS